MITGHHSDASTPSPSLVQDNRYSHLSLVRTVAGDLRCGVQKEQKFISHCCKGRVSNDRVS